MKTKSLKRKKRLGKGEITLLVMTIPSILFIAAFAYLPMVGWIYSFFDYRIGYDLFMCKFVGLDNFKYAFADTYLIKVIINTLVISGISLLGLPIACTIAILLSEVKFKKFTKSVQTAITLPNFISWIIIYSIVYALLSNEGMINSVLINLGIIDSGINILSNVKIAWFFQGALYIWKVAGYNSIIFFASIASIDSELYDAANVDGAGRWSRIRFIIVPSLLPTLLILLLIQIGFILSNGFDQFYVFMNPIVQTQIEVLDYYVYRIGMLENDIPVSTAVSMTKTFISVIMIFSVNKLAKKLTGNSVI